MKSRAKNTLLCLLGLAVLLSPGLVSAATLGLAPAAYSLETGQRSALAKLPALVTERLGRPVAIRSLPDESALQDWLLRFREVDAALLTQAFYRRQPAGALVALTDIFTVNDGDSPSLVLVAAPGREPEEIAAWRDAFLAVADDPAAHGTLEGAGIKAIARPGVKLAAAVKPAPAPLPVPASVTEPTAAPPAVSSPAQAAPAIKGSPLESGLAAGQRLQPAEPPPQPVSVPDLAAPKKTVDQAVASRLDLAELIRLVVQQNQRIQMNRAQFDIKQAEEEKTHAIFEPSFVASFHLEDGDSRNTAEESVNRLSEDVYSMRNWDYTASLQGVFPTGARYKLFYTLSDLSNSVNRDLYGRDEQQMNLGLDLRQPLLKNAGVSITRSGIEAAAAESRASFHDFRQEMMRTVSEAAVIYWNHYRAQEKFKLRQESVRIAEKIMTDNRERVRTGKMAETEVLEAEAGVAARSSLLSETAHELRETGNLLKQVLAIDAMGLAPPVKVEEPSAVSIVSPERAALLQQSFALRPDYLAALERLEQANIKIAFARNQRWPELDLIASYGLNGLGFSRGNAWGQIEGADYTSWAVGMEFRLPLQGGIDSRSELKKQELEKIRQLWALKDIEVTIANGIDTALHQVSSAKEQLDYANRSAAIRKQLLDVETARLQAGKSQSRQVLEKEDSYRIAREEYLDNKVKLQTALIDLEMADGSLLVNNGVEIMEREF